MKIQRREKMILGILCALSAATYLISAVNTAGIGFPLDDAWIHQTYARNLANGNGWSFVPGHPSAGVTAPLWALILVLGNIIKAGPFTFTFFIGWILLWSFCLVAAAWMHKLLPEKPGWSLAAGSLIAFEWHLVWAAFSGMETILFSFLALLIFSYLSDKHDIHAAGWFGLGAIAGLSVWVRPEGITLIAPLVFVSIFSKRKWKSMVYTLFGFALLLLPYLYFNRWLAGTWWPNTFYAKQAEYAVLRQQPIAARLGNQLVQPLVGVGVVLLPGFFYCMVEAVRSRRWGLLAGGLWMIGHLSIYAWRLPVTYQHGRYAMPAMPVFFLWGLLGTAWLARPRDTQHWWRVISRVWLTSIIVIVLVFWGIGAQAYADDVAVINTEMVAAARWISEHTKVDELIAAHDIGALGYYGERQLIDLAGLISPQVIPFIRDEGQLEVFLDQHKADFLMTFPGWYPALTSDRQPIFQTTGGISPALGGENMAVYRWSE